jgi:predicted dehydrogenase
MAMNASEARRMRDAAAQRPQLIAQVVPSPMTLAFDAEIRRRIDAGELGRILAVEVRDRQGWFDPDAPLTWRQDERLSGLNTLTLGIWYEAVLRWLGPAESVRADGRVFAETRRDGSGEAHEVVLPEHLDVIARLACGAQMHMGLSSVCGAAGASQVWIFGSEATLSLRGGELLEARRGETDLSPQEVPEQRRGRWRVEEEFVNAIRGREEVTLTDFDTGVAYMEFTEAVAQSLRAGREIGIPASATP